MSNRKNIACQTFMLYALGSESWHAVPTEIQSLGIKKLACSSNGDLSMRESWHAVPMETQHEGAASR